MLKIKKFKGANMEVRIDLSKLITSGCFISQVGAYIKFCDIDGCDDFKLTFKFLDSQELTVSKEEDSNGLTEVIVTNDKESTKFGFANFKLNNEISLSLSVEKLTSNLLKIDYSVLKITEENHG